MNLLYSKAKLIHADLSEYNILVNMNDMEPVIIDMGQSVTADHFHAEAYLRRDVTNIVQFFKKYNIPINEDELISIVKEGRK